jgi:hypothetical protein
MSKRVTLLLTSLTILLAIIFTLNGATASSHNKACGVNFYSDQVGYGGVEICSIGYPCGRADGVCPQNFSRGQNETTKDYYRHPFVKYATPSSRNVTDTSQEPVIAYENGQEACQRLGGTCQDILEGNSKNGSFSPSPSNNCADAATDYDNNASYYRAQCTGVPKVAGCENCPDPDCKANVTGYVADTNDRSIANASISLSNAENPVLNQSPIEERLFAKSNGTGAFRMSKAVSGYMTVTCGKTRYETQQFETYVQPGQDTITCPSLGAAACTANCTAPDAFGNEVCVASCDQRNGCNMSDQEQEYCQGLPQGTQRYLTRVNDTHVNVTNCCDGPIETIYRPLSDISANATGVEQLEITDYQRELDGTPVTVKVVRYTD